MSEVNSKIRSYVNVLFTDVPRTKKAIELKEEILSNMNERFQDYLNEGKTENEAYGQTVASMTDIDAMLAEVAPNADFHKEAGYYRKHNAKWTSIAVAMYILGAAVLIGFSVFMGGNGAIIGLVMLLVLVAAATAILIYTRESTPVEYRDYDEQRERAMYSTPEGRKFKAAKSIYWTVIVAVYLGASFITMRWDITWIIWPIAGVLSGIFDNIYEMRNADNEQ